MGVIIYKMIVKYIIQPKTTKAYDITHLKKEEVQRLSTKYSSISKYWEDKEGDNKRN